MAVAFFGSKVVVVRVWLTATATWRASDRRSLRGRELQDAARRSQPIANSALMYGAQIMIEKLEAENQRLRDQLEHLSIELDGAA